MQLERIRNLYGYSRSDLAKKAGVSRQIIWKWEKGKSIPSAEKAIRLANIFGVTVEDLMK